MMFLQVGVAFLMIWLMNWLWMLWEILRHTPNWRDDGVDSDEIAQNFMTNTPIEKLQMIQKIAELNPMLGMTGVAFLLLAMVI
jgi:hypothetical protein